MKLIDAEGIEYKTVSMCLTSQYCHGYNDAVRHILNDLPSVDAVPVRHAYWQGADGGVCSACGFRVRVSERGLYRYCPNCGAQMEAAEDEAD